jgi:DNA processing protein
MDFQTHKTYQLALHFIKGLGPSTYTNLIEEYGTAEAVFQLKEDELKEFISHKKVIKAILDKSTMKKAESEFQFCQKHGIDILHYTDKAFPKRILYFDNTPRLLFFRGNADLNTHKIVSIVGTRQATERGKILCQKIIESLVGHNALIVSGLAYGVDVAAHKMALRNKLPTVGVVAHGLDDLYPGEHKSTATKMLDNGGILTEFPSNTEMIRELFPMRNRIVASMCDALIVVESAKKGGSLITANFANEYGKDVFAIPGRPNDEFSEGCNLLIKSHRAHMYEHHNDLEYIMRWDKPKKVKQGQLFPELSDNQSEIIHCIRNKGECHIDEISKITNRPTSKLAADLLQLELKGLIKSIAGKRYICI